jgi:hypothetical protein
VYSRAERVFILEPYLASKYFSAVRDVFSNAYPEKEVPNKTTIHRLEKISGYRTSLSASDHRATKQLKLWPYRFQAVHQLQQRDTAGRIQYCSWFRCFVREGIYV